MRQVSWQEIWSGPSAVTFGNEGTPFYISGPYDTPRQVLMTLNRSVGRDNYHFVSGEPEFGDLV
ncbi:hypothetical protein [Microbispora sp. NPDC049125]|uniref:hypothetical protein n=1 Tax=Microbispora sp. NPDC049125 TaxID=3154929 RepID=UPI0034662482